MALTCSNTYREQCAKMQYLGAQRMGNVLETFPDVCCCEVCTVQRLKCQEFVRMCARKVQ